MNAAEISESIAAILEFAASREVWGTAHWFNVFDISREHSRLMREFQKSGVRSSGLEGMLLDLPTSESNELNDDAVSAILDIMAQKEYLRREANPNWPDSFEITAKGRATHSRRKLSKPRKRREQRPRIVVITIRDDEQLAILRRVAPGEPYPGKHRTYATGSIPNCWGPNHQLAIVGSIEQGPQPAQDVARDAIEDLEPTLVVLLGIGGGIPSSDYTLGDVIVAKRLHDFSVGAQIEGKGRELANQGGPMAKSVGDLVSLIPSLESTFQSWNQPASVRWPRPTVTLDDPKRFYGSPAFRKRSLEALRKHFEDDKRDRPRAYAGSIASSGDLIKDTATIEQWRRASREIVAVEMELAGVYAAAQRRRRVYPVLAIRGISDIVGFKRDDSWTKYACDTAASFCVALLSNLPRNHFR